MNTKSIRFRLSAWYTVAFVVATVVIFATFYAVTSTTFISQTDSQLSIHGHKLVQSITTQDIGMNGMLSKQAMLQELSDAGMVIAIVDSKGQVLVSSLSSNQSNGVFTDLFNRTKISPKKAFQNRPIGESSFRLIIIPIFQQGVFAGAAIVGHPIDVIEKSLTSLLVTLIVFVIILAVPAAFGGYVLANRGLQPITDISGRLKQIGSENLSERVPIPGTGDELSELAGTFNNLLDRLSWAFEREKQFIGDVAHELKTPLATLRSTAEISLSKKRSNDEYRQVILGTVIDADRMNATLKDVLDLAWSESDSVSKDSEVFNLSESVKDLVPMARRLALPKQISVRSDIKENILVAGKQEKMFRALLNLVDNAVKYTEKRGRVSIRVDRVNASARVLVMDNGQGISLEDQPHIFDRFYRGVATDKTHGTGLGLAIARAIVRAHRGTIEVKSQPGKGSEFTILLPVASS